MRNNLARTYEGWGAETISQGSLIRAQVMFLLAWLHAIVQASLTLLDSVGA